MFSYFSDVLIDWEQIVCLFDFDFKRTEQLEFSIKMSSVSEKSNCSKVMVMTDCVVIFSVLVIKFKKFNLKKTKAYF